MDVVKEEPRIDVSASVFQRIMEVRTGGTAGVACGSDFFSGSYCLAFADVYGREVAIGDGIVVMADFHEHSGEFLTA